MVRRALIAARRRPGRASADTPPSWARAFVCFPPPLRGVKLTSIGNIAREIFARIKLNLRITNYEFFMNLLRIFFRQHSFKNLNSFEFSEVFFCYFGANFFGSLKHRNLL